MDAIFVFPGFVIMFQKKSEKNTSQVLFFRRKIKGIPQEFDTDFYLARWWRAYQGDLQLIRTYMKQLFEHRRLLGYDRIDTEGLRTKLDMACKTFEVFRVWLGFRK